MTAAGRARRLRAAVGAALVVSVLTACDRGVAPDTAAPLAATPPPAATTHVAGPAPVSPPTPLDQVFRRAAVVAITGADGRLDVVPGPHQARNWPAAVAQARAAGYVTGASGDGAWLFTAATTTVVVVPPARAWIALIVDDVGFRSDHVEAMLAWRVPMTFSVIPHRPRSASLAAAIRAAGQSLFIHQPMEPYDYPEQDPGANALFLRDGAATWRRTLADNLAALPGASGLNNHMGSRFSEDASATTALAAWLRSQGLMFVDSLTSPKSRAAQACRDAGVPTLVRDVFLDHERSPQFLDQQIDTWLATADRKGLAIAIVHPHALTVERVGAALERIRAAGYRWVGADLLRGVAAARLKET